MNVRIEQIGPCRRDVHIEVPADEVGQEYQAVLDSYAKVARVPGFRPGRAPRDLVHRRYAKDIRQEVKDRLLPRAYQAAVKEQKIDAVSVLDVKDEALEQGRPFSFTVQLDVAPDFNMPKYVGIEVETRPAAVKPEDVEQTITNLRNQAGRFEDVAGRAVQLGDLVQVDFDGVLDGESVEALAPQAKGIGQGRDFWAMADAANSFLPGFGEALVGASVGDRRDIQITFPAELSVKTLAGRTAVYATTVKAIRERKPAELNAEFFTPLKVDSIEALRERVGKELAEMREAEEQRRRRGAVIQYLLKNTALEVPESQVARETHQEVYDFVQQSQYRGVSGDEIESRKEEIFETAARNATDRVKLRYILKRIAAEEKLEVTSEEVTVQIMALARQHRVTPEKLRADLAERGTLPRVEDDIRVNKALDLLVAKAALKAAPEAS